MDKLKDLDQFKELRDSGKTVFVFMTGWCPDCHYIIYIPIMWYTGIHE